MGLTTKAGELLADAIIGGTSFNKFSAANANLAVGSGNTAFVNTQTDLQGASKTRKAMDGGYPSRTTNKLTFRATFGPTDANYAWEEWAVFNAASGGEMLNRKVESNGTKSSSATWQLSVDITLNVA